MKQVVKFQLNELLGIGMTIVILGIGLAYGLEVMSDVQDDIGEAACADDYAQYPSYNTSNKACYNASSGDHIEVGSGAFNGSTDAMTAVAKLPEKLPTIVTVVVAAVIIGILVTYLWARFR